ncbi:MAG: tetratricopeptide repeat protein [Pyrinomonadaceae bacterium]
MFTSSLFRISITRAIAIAAVIVSFAMGVAPSLVNAQEEDTTAQSAVAEFNKAQDAHEKGDLRAALSLYDKALEIMPEFPEAELQRGNALLSLGRTDEAEAAFRRSLELKPDWTLAMASLGSLLVLKDRTSEADTILTKAIELDQQNASAYASLADLRLRTHASPPVLRELLGSIKILTSKANPTASLVAAQASLEGSLAITASAKRTADRALELDPKNQLALSVLFDSAIADRDAGVAASILARIEQFPSRTRDMPVLKARLLLLQDKPVDALAVLNAFKDPSPEILALRDKIAATRIAGSAELEKLLESNPSDADVLGRLCSALRVEDPRKALDYCRRAAAAEPSNISHAIGYAAALVQAKNYDAAVDLLRKILAVAPDNSTVHANLATALFQLQRYEEAKAEYRWLILKQPETAVAYFFLAVAHDHLNEFPDALDNYQLFLKIADANVNGLEIEKVKLRLPSLEKQIKEKKGRKSDAKE